MIGWFPSLKRPSGIIYHHHPNMASRRRSPATSEATNEDDDDVFLYKMGMTVPKNVVTRVRCDKSVRSIPLYALRLQRFGRG